MQKFIYLFALTIAVYAAPQCNQTITVTNTWHQPPTPVTNYCNPFYTFIIPADSYANVTVAVTHAAFAEIVALFDSLGPRFDVSGDSTEGVSVIFPSTFYVAVEYSVSFTLMQLEITVAVTKLPKPTSVTKVSTDVNKQPTVIYFKDWLAGTSFTFTSSSSSSKVAVLVDPDFQHNGVEEQVLLNNVFITEGGVNRGTLATCWDGQCISKTKEITLHLIGPANLLGAILVTDYDNIKNLIAYKVQYVPVRAGSNSGIGYASFESGDDRKPGFGAITVIGLKNGVTPITVKTVDNYGDGGHFTFLSGGPVANFGVVAAPLTKKMLPKTLSGTLNTFMLSQGYGQVVYSF